MSKIGISKEKIIAVAKAGAVAEGINALNMRTIAKQCNIAVGSIYNYFPTKSDLIIAVVEDFWKTAFHPILCSLDTTIGFVEIVKNLYDSASVALDGQHDFLVAHAIAVGKSNKEKGRDVMERYFAHIKSALLTSLQSDSRIQQSIWSQEFTPEKLVEFVFSNMISTLAKVEDNCDFLLELLQRLLYTEQ